MRSFVCSGDAPDNLLGQVFAGQVDEVQQQLHYLIGSTRVLLLIGRKFYFRSSDYLGVVVLAVANGAVERIDISYAGGGSGMLGLQWGAGDRLETDVANAIAEALRNAGVRFQEGTGTAQGPGAGGSTPLP